MDGCGGGPTSAAARRRCAVPLRAASCRRIGSARLGSATGGRWAATNRRARCIPPHARRARQRIGCTCEPARAGARTGSARGTTGPLTGYSRGTHGVLTGYSLSTHAKRVSAIRSGGSAQLRARACAMWWRVPREYPASTLRVHGGAYPPSQNSEPPISSLRMYLFGE